MHRLVGAHRNRADDVLQDCIVAGGEGLLDQFHACRLRRGEQTLEVGCAPCLVGVGDQPCIRHRSAHGGKPRFVAIAAKLELEQGIMRCVPRPRRHLVRRGERDGERRLDRMERRNAGKLGRAASRDLGLEVPQRAVERIARRARRQQRLKPCAVEAARDGGRASLDRCDHALDALAVARVGHAFASAGRGAVADRRHHHHGLVLCAARDGKPAPDRPALEAELKVSALLHSCLSGRQHNAFLSPAFSVKNKPLSQRPSSFWLKSMLKRDHTLSLSTQARAPGFRVELKGTTFRLIASGAWTVAEAVKLDAALKRLRVPIPPTPDFTGEMDIAGIAEIDTAGAWLLQRTAAAWQAGGLRTRYAGATEGFRILIEEVQTRGNVERPKVKKTGAGQQLVEDVTKALTGVWSDAIQLTSFLGEVTAGFARMVMQPWRFRPKSFVHHLDHAGLRAVPIIALICFLIGAVVMQQGVVQLKPFGAEPFAVNMVAILALREVGILLTAIMVAGRSGSAFTAEIGSMKMREEIDAMRTLGIDPMDTLVLPRVLALIVALPLLTFIGDITGLMGGGVMAIAVLGLDVSTYIDKLHETVDFQHFMAGMIKAPFAALIIGLVGCLEGLSVAGSAESLGKHVTSAVVKAIFLVIILDAIFAMFLSAIGM